MDRLRVIINGTDYTLQMCDVPSGTWNLSGWSAGTQGDAKYFYTDPATIGTAAEPGILNFQYGTFIIMLENGMYLNLQYDETYGIYSDFVQYSVLFSKFATNSVFSVMVAV